MPLSVDQLRSFDSNWGNLVLQQDNGDTKVKAGGLRHALASLFHTHGAETRNKATYDAIHDAIMHEERFAAPDVKAKAQELLQGLGSGSRIKASTIKDIIGQLDAMSTPEKQRESVRKSAIGHLAARGVPGNIPASVQEKYKQLAAEFAVYGLDAGESISSIRVDQRVDEFNQMMSGIFTDLNDDDAAAVFCRMLSGIAAGDGAVSVGNVADRIRTLAAALKDNMRELDAIGGSHGAALREILLTTLKSTGALRPGALTALADKGASLPTCGLDILKGQSGAGAIHRAISKMAEAMDKARLELPAQTMRGLDNDAIGACLVKSVLARLPENARRNLLAALESKGGMNLLGYYAQHSDDPKAQSMSLAYSTLLAHLRAEFNGDESDAAVQAPSANVAALPPEAIYDFSLDDVITGAAANQIKALSVGKSGIASVAELQSRMNAIAKTAVTMTIITGMDSLRAGPELGQKSGPPLLDDVTTGFDKDFVRAKQFMPDYLTFLMDDGTPEKPQTPAEARDAFVKFITGDPNAEYKNVTDVQLKTKVHILMTCIEQATASTVGIAFGTAMDPAGAKAPITYGGDQEEKYVLSKDENGAITINYKLHHSPLIVVFNDEGGLATTDANASLDSTLAITFPADDLDRLASANWSKLASPIDLRALEKSKTPHKYETLQRSFDDDKSPYKPFSFQGEVSTSTSLHIDSLDMHTYH